MELRSVILWVVCSSICVTCLPIEHESVSKTDNDEQKLFEFLRNDFEKEASEILNKQTIAEWELEADINNQTKSNALLNQTLTTAKFNKNVWEKHFKGMNLENIQNSNLKRQIFFLSNLEKDALDEQKLTQLKNVETKMSNIYSTAKICPYKHQNCDLNKDGLSLEPEIIELMASSKDYDELEYIWSSWRNASGAKMREDYKIYVNLSNEAARLNGFSDMGASWRSYYESENLVQEIDELWADVKPLYDELHTYVLNKLRNRYSRLKDRNDNLIPAHILGNLWGQSWVYLYDLVKPFPNASTIDVTKELKQQDYTPKRMFEVADEFFHSLGLEPNDICYNVSAGAIIEKPEDREIVCHASAWDFYDGKNYRVKMCTTVNEENFVTIHHEMGHIQYYLLYKNQPITFRTGANPGFHEAVGDTIALSVSTPQHLQKIGLLKNYEETEESSLNALMYIALKRVAFLPFGYLIDKWRWDVFSGNVSEGEWNERWWYYREKIQKIKAPNNRTEQYFDPGAKFHIPGNTQYIAYFIAHLLEFQFHEALCIEAKQFDPDNQNSKPLHSCDIYQSKEAGSKLRAGLSLGASRHWTEALEAITGTKKQSGKALLKYFQPLYNYLKKENEKLLSAAEQTVIGELNNNTEEAPTDHTLPIVFIGILAIIAVLCIVSYLVIKCKKK